MNTVQTALPPYALGAPTFRFRALAALAARASLGGPREVVLATYLVARLAHDCLPARTLSLPVRRARGAAARAWLASTALPAAVRAALVRLAEATEAEVPNLGEPLRSAVTATTGYLDHAARSELERLSGALSA